MKKLFSKILRWAQSAIVTRTYQHTFCGGIRVSVDVSTTGSFKATFSEALPEYMVEEWHRVRDEFLADFQKQTGRTISARQLRNESARPVSSITQRHIEAMRNTLNRDL